jgi:hypothetical protein
MIEVGQKLETKKEPFVAEVIARNLSNSQYTLIVNGSKVILNEDAINLLMDKSEDIKPVFKVEEKIAEIKAVPVAPVVEEKKKSSSIKSKKTK